MTAETRQFFMCPPDHFRVDYAINAWTDPGAEVDSTRALEQWERLYAVYVDAGARVARRFARRGYHVEQLPEGMHFEGNAEAIHWNGMLLAGWGVRSDRSALDHLCARLDLELHAFQLAAPYYHFDVCLAPIDERTALYYPGAFTAQGREQLARLVPRLIAVNEREAKALACNSVSVHGTVVMSTTQAPRVAELLCAAGKRVVALDVSEFQKAGGGVKCLTLEAYQPAQARQAVA
jgi:N-dimethylarginine dimethylaminohydrolase